MLGPSNLTVVAGMGLVVVAMGVVGYAYTRGYASCESDVAINNAPVQEAAYQAYRAAIERGDKLSADLAVAQRKLSTTKTEYLAYANGIAGNCSADVRVLAHYAARGEPVPEAASAPTDAAAPADSNSTVETSAADLAANIAENYTICLETRVYHEALIDWYKGQQ